MRRSNKSLRWASGGISNQYYYYIILVGEDPAMPDDDSDSKQICAKKMKKTFIVFTLTLDLESSPNIYLKVMCANIISVSVVRINFRFTIYEEKKMCREIRTITTQIYLCTLNHALCTSRLRRKRRQIKLCIVPLGAFYYYTF